MYPRDAYRRLLDLIRSGLLDINLLRFESLSTSRVA